MYYNVIIIILIHKNIFTLDFLFIYRRNVASGILNFFAAELQEIDLSITSFIALSKLLLDHEPLVDFLT